MPSQAQAEEQHFGIKCKYHAKQGKEEWVQVKDWDRHIHDFHPESMEEQIISMISKTSEQVDYILSRTPQALDNNGVLLQKAFKLFPVYSNRYIYDPANLQVGFIASSYDDFIYGLKHCETITRCGRAWRRNHPEAAEQYEAKQQERQEEYRFSTHFWKQESNAQKNV